MKVALAATGKFHYFDLAKQLAERDALALIFTGYPRWKLGATTIPDEKIRTIPWMHTFYMGTQRLSAQPHRWSETLDWVDRASFDYFVANNLPQIDVFTGISGCGMRSGVAAKNMGARYVCDRGSTHILYQNDILKREHDEWGLPFTPTHPKIIERELAEYESADLITVPSLFAKQSFVSAGVAELKIKVIPYGVDLERFEPTASPQRADFVVAYVGGINLRKGIQYLVQAFSRLAHPRKALWLIGQADRRFIDRLKKLGLLPAETVFMGHVDQAQLKGYLSQASVLVLPSVEDGFGLVMAQAMACGCPVIASSHTGAAEIVQPSINGHIVPAQSAEALADALQQMADAPDQLRMRAAARESVQKLGGWRHYGDQVFAAYRSLCGAV